MAGVREWIAHEAAQAFNDARLEAGGEGDGWRAFTSNHGDFIVDEQVKQSWWQRHGEWVKLCWEMHNTRHFEAQKTELQGPERARIVREFLEWKGAQ